MFLKDAIIKLSKGWQKFMEHYTKFQNKKIVFLFKKLNEHFGHPVAFHQYHFLCFYMFS